MEEKIDPTFYLELRDETEGVLFHQIYNGDPPSRIIHQTSNFVVLCDIAPLILGHLIIIPKHPWVSLGKIPEHQWDELIRLKIEVNTKLTTLLSKPTFLEHGSCSSMISGGCITHAHLHAVPCRVDLMPSLKSNGLAIKKIEDIKELKKLGGNDKTYIFFEDTNSDMYISEIEKKIRKQYIRIEIANSVGVEDPYWDWGVHINKDLLRETINLFKTETWESV